MIRPKSLPWAFRKTQCRKIYAVGAAGFSEQRPPLGRVGLRKRASGREVSSALKDCCEGNQPEKLRAARCGDRALRSSPSGPEAAGAGSFAKDAGSASWTFRRA